MNKKRNKKLSMRIDSSESRLTRSGDELFNMQQGFTPTSIARARDTSTSASLAVAASRASVASSTCSLRECECVCVCVGEYGLVRICFWV